MKLWFVYISQAFSLVFTVTPTLPHLIRIETETNIWSYYPGTGSLQSESESRSVLSDFSTSWTIVHGNLQATILEWVAFPFSRASLQTRARTGSPTLQVDSLPAEPQGSPRILEWVAYPFSSRPSRPRNRTGVSCIAGGFFTN